MSGTLLCRTGQRFWISRETLNVVAKSLLDRVSDSISKLFEIIIVFRTSRVAELVLTCPNVSTYLVVVVEAVVANVVLQVVLQPFVAGTIVVRSPRSVHSHAKIR